jgi:1-acyl-sn-glycerol-3-phosphate acyltransferase
MPDTDLPKTESEFIPPLLAIIESLMREIRGERATPVPVHLDSSLERDLGLDSLARVELLARLERHFGLALAERVFAEADTPRDLLRALSKAGATGPAPREVRAVPRARPEAQAVPHQAQTLIEVLQWHVQAHPDRPHIQLYNDQADIPAINYRQLHAGAVALAGGLQQRGLLPGDAVAIMLPTGKEYFFSFFGILLAGCVPVPIYPPARPNQLEEHLRRHAAILRNCRAAALVTIPEAKAVARLLQSLVENLQQMLTVAELMEQGGGYRPPALAPQDTAFLQYTSGSTGSPKGVVLSHANLLANIRTMGERVRADAGDVFVSWLPLYHDMGLIGAWLGSLYYGALFVVMSPLAFLARPQRWLQAIHHYGGTLSAAPNFGYELCLHRLEDADLNGLDLSSWRAAFNGAEAVSPRTVREFPRRLRPCGFRPEAMLPVYGLAENCVGLAFPPLGRGVRIDHIQRRPFMDRGEAVPAAADDATALQFVACGQPLAQHEIRIADAQGRELPERREGHLQFRGPSATSGYLHNQEATRALFVDGWLDSGDLAYVAGGELYVTGRSKDIVIRAGRNLYPHELEEAVGDIDGIRKGRVAVFGATNHTTGTERLVVLAESHAQDSAVRGELRKAINATASRLMGGPADEVVLAPPGTVLKTSSGKIRRSACRDLYERGYLAKRPAPVWRQVSRMVLASGVPQLRRLQHKVVSTSWMLYATGVFWLLAPLTWLAVVTAPAAAWRWWLMRRAVQILAQATATPLRIEGRQWLPPKDQACVFVANHASYLDGPLLIAALQRPFAFVAKAELARQPIAGTFLRRIGSEFVERFDIQKGVEDARRMAALAGAGRALGFFPEGTFSRSPGLLPFHLGAFLTAARAGLPVVPVAIRGSRSVLRGDSKTPHHGSITITIGEPIRPAAGQEDAWASALQLRDAARHFILRHCGEPDLGPP